MIKDFFREDLKYFKAYEGVKENCSIKMDANESFISFPEALRRKLIQAVEGCLYNRYPDPEAKKVCRLYGDYVGVDAKNIMAGNGSDELIQMIANTFIEKGDAAAALDPDFSMYEIYTKISGGRIVKFPLDENFKLDVQKLIEWVNGKNVKVLFFSNPNNPTGGVIPQEQIIEIIKKCRSIVVVDEAYFEFYGKTIADKINQYENLIVLRTCSKALGLAALRLGFLITCHTLMDEIRKVKPPYNVNSLSQEAASVILQNPYVIKKNIESIIGERNFLYNALLDMKGVAVYPTHSNFILVRVNDAEKTSERLAKRNIRVRNFGTGRLEYCLRITAGTREENEYFLKSLLEYGGI